MSIVINGNTGFKNRGVEALIQPIVAHCRKRFPEWPIHLLSYDHSYDQMRLAEHGDKVKVHRDVYQWFGRFTRAGFPMSITAKKLLPELAKCDNLVKNCKLFISTGGDLFGSEYGGNFRMFLHPMDLAAKSGAKVVLLAHSIGPFRKQAHAEDFVNTAKNADLFTLRERLSYDYVTKDLGLTNNVHFTADTAFLLDPADEDQSRAANAFYGLDPERPVIALAISAGIAKFVENGDASRHLESWKKIIPYITSEIGAQVLLVPHVQKNLGIGDDRIIQTRLAAEMNFANDVRIVGAEHSAGEFKGIIRCCDLVVAERMHAAIAGLSTCTPTCAIQYSVKAEGITKDLFGEDPASIGALLTFDDLLDPAKACETIKLAWNNRDTMRDKLNANVPPMKERSSSNYDMIAKLFE